MDCRIRCIYKFFTDVLKTFDDLNMVSPKVGEMQEVLCLRVEKCNFLKWISVLRIPNTNLKVVSPAWLQQTLIVTTNKPFCIIWVRESPFWTWVVVLLKVTQWQPTCILFSDLTLWNCCCCNSSRGYVKQRIRQFLCDINITRVQWIQHRLQNRGTGLRENV